MKQFCTPRAENPGNVLLTSRNPPKYFNHCSGRGVVYMCFLFNSLVNKIIKV